MSNSIQRLEMRVDEKTKQMAERASAAAGCSLTEYVTRLIREDAPQVLKAQAEIELANEQFDRFIDICKANKAPSPRILDAANRLDDEGFV